MKELRSLQEWEDVLQESFEKPVVVLKHSNACPISKEAYEEMISLGNDGLLESSLYFLVVQSGPEISEHIAHALNMKHESPQVLILHNGRLVWSDSHFNVTKKAVLKNLSSL